MFHDGQHSRFNDRHRQQADACGLTPGLYARSAQKGAVPGFLPGLFGFGGNHADTSANMSL
jgi:hypothetical protein